MIMDFLFHKVSSLIFFVYEKISSIEKKVSLMNREVVCICKTKNKQEMLKWKKLLSNLAAYNFNSSLIILYIVVILQLC